MALSNGNGAVDAAVERSTDILYGVGDMVRVVDSTPEERDDAGDIVEISPWKFFGGRHGEVRGQVSPREGRTEMLVYFGIQFSRCVPIEPRYLALVRRAPMVLREEEIEEAEEEDILDEKTKKAEIEDEKGEEGGEEKEEKKEEEQQQQQQQQHIEEEEEQEQE